VRSKKEQDSKYGFGDTHAGEKLSKQLAHVEISFPFSIDNKCFEDEQTMGFSIVQNKTVSLRLKHWRPEYTAIRMYIDSCVYLKLYQTCIAHTAAENANAAWHILFENYYRGPTAV